MRCRRSRRISVISLTDGFAPETLVRVEPPRRLESSCSTIELEGERAVGDVVVAVDERRRVGVGGTSNLGMERKGSSLVIRLGNNILLFSGEDTGGGGGGGSDGGGGPVESVNAPPNDAAIFGSDITGRKSNLPRLNRP